MPEAITHAVIDTSAIADNVRAVKNSLPEECRLCAVVKCDGYGHGAVRAAGAAVNGGASWLATSTVKQALKLRNNAITVPILALMPPLPEQIPAAIDASITTTVTDTAHVMQLQRQAEDRNETARVHLYHDLGTAYLGGDEDEGILDVLELAEQWPQVEVEGIYSHIGPPGSEVSIDQLEWVQEGASLKMYAATLLEAVSQIAGRRLIFHVASSGSLIQWHQPEFDMVRIGKLLYGRYPDYVTEQERLFDLQPTFAIRSRIIDTHTVPEGTPVGEGGEFICRRPTRLATVPAGTCHGISPQEDDNQTGWMNALINSLLSGGPEASVKGLGQAGVAYIDGEAAPIVGRPAMDRCCIDVTDIGSVDVGAAVTIPADSLAVCTRTPRIERQWAETIQI